MTDFLLDGASFKVEGTSIMVIDNPLESISQWQYRIADVPGTTATENW